MEKEAFKSIYLTKVNISHNYLREVRSHVFKFCENMTVLDLSHNKIERISPVAFDETSYATEMRLNDNLLTSMSQVPMTSQRGIKILNVSNNLIQDIPKKTFPKLYELHTIDFSNNNLTEIGRSVFVTLLSLRHLIFRNNSLSVLESSTFGKIPTLLDMDLSHNRLSRVRRGAFQGLVSIRKLVMDYNNMTEIPLPGISLIDFSLANNQIHEIKGRQAWPVMNSLIRLNLDNNFLGESLTGGRFDNLNTLGMLSLRGNNITKVPRDALSSLQSLQHLHLDRNNLTQLPKDAFGNLRVVSRLTLSGNNLFNISYGAFEKMLQIQTLDLSRNKLRYIRPGAFLGLVALRNLDLSHNQLQRLQNRTHGLLEDCLSIKSVNLSHNNIGFLSTKMFPEHRWIPYKLESVDLSYNRLPVITNEITRGTKHLKHLNVSYNILNNIRAGTLENLTTLEILDISGNGLVDKVLDDVRVFGTQVNLTHLSMHSNRFTRLPVADLTKHKRLVTLDIRNNRIQGYDPEFTDMVKNQGLQIRYFGNPLRCDCRLRPVSYWIESVGRAQGRAGAWEEAVCASPGFLEGQPVSEVSELKLICVDSKHNETEFRLNPDVVFREVNEQNGGLELTWYVSTNEDVGDFRLEVQTRSFPRSTLFSKDLSYNTRSQSIRGVSSDSEVSMCLLAKTSTGRIRRWKQDQCRIVGPLYGSAPGIKGPSAHLVTSTSILSIIVILHLL